ncbi:MAG: hypothetical protein ACE5EF_12855 [Dehalococcoidia bacterium]
MAEGSLITDEIRALIGRQGEPSRVAVGEEAVRRAIGSFGGDQETPLAAGDPVPGVALMNIAPFREDQELGLRDLMPASILVSNEFSIERPIRLGEEFSAASRVADITERLGGQFGHALYVRHEVEFRDGQGLVVGRTASTMMHYDPSARR